MKLIRWFNLVMVLTLLFACSRPGIGETPGLSTPQTGITHTPSAETAMRTFLEAQTVEDYPTMYGMLSQTSQAAITLEDFTKRYLDSLNYMAVQKMEYNLLSMLTTPGTAQVAYHIIYHTAPFGDIQSDMVANLNLEKGEWRLKWDANLILSQLQNGNKLYTDYQIPSRGDIFDRKGTAIVTHSDAYALGVVPGEITAGGSVLEILSQLTGMTQDTIYAMYSDYPSSLYYFPIGEAPAKVVDPLLSSLSNYSGLYVTAYSARYYFDGGIAPHAVGFMQYLSKANQQAYQRKGYSGSELIGTAGIEKWGEPYLAGKHGATLYLAGPDGKIVNTLAETASKPASSITLTIDKDFQEQAQNAMDGMPGAIVVLERDTGRVLAMVSSPAFDPNLFMPGNKNNSELANVLQDQTQPLFNRAAQGKYPLGSVFKLVTMAAALESGIFTKDSTYECGYHFTDIPGFTLNDWTWDHCKREEATPDGCTTQPSGLLTLPQALMRSCNPWFAHIGTILYDSNRGNAISDMARQYGLGRTTGIEIEEEAGNIPNPGDGIAAVNISIGQGDVQVTPLQVASFTAALGNGGTLYRPQIVEKIQSADGNPLLTFKPDGRSLGIKAETLNIIQAAMHEVVKNPRGTAYSRLSSLKFAVSGKTGTAESGVPGFPHAWFAGYTMENNPDRPDIAVAVIVENKGEGSDYAAPIFRRIVELYFTGQPQSVYPFESAIGATAIPTPGPGTPEPTP